MWGLFQWLSGLFPFGFRTHKIRKRISGALPVVKKLDIFWKKATCSVKWKLNVYNAVVLTKLAYGLETLQFTTAQGNPLDAFQQRGLRKILGIAPTYIDRSHTNEEVIRLANIAKGCDEDETKTKIIPLTETIKQRKQRLLGHVIRAGHRDPRDPMYQVTFENSSLQPRTTACRRVGKPRHKWHTDTMQSAWEAMNANSERERPYTGDDRQREEIKQRAIARQTPFDRTKNERLKSRADRGW